MEVDLLFFRLLELLFADVDHLVLGQTQGSCDAGAGLKSWVGVLGLAVVVSQEEDCILNIARHLHYFL